MNKRISIIFGAVLCINVAHAQTETITWDVDGVTTTTTCESGGNITLPTAPTKPGYMFLGWSGFTPIEYIESTGTQYIDTGFKPNQNTRVSMEYMVPSSMSTAVNVTMFGARDGSENKAFAEWYLIDQNKYRSDFNRDHDAGTLSNSFYDVKITVDKDKNSTTLTTNNGTLLNYVSSTATFQTSYNLLIGALNNGGAIVGLNNITIYSFKLYDNDTLVRDMIPVLDPDDVPCMYDKVNNQFYYNAGTGTFTAGPVL